MATYLDDEKRGEAQILVAETLESIEALSLLLEAYRESGGPGEPYAPMHAIRDVLVVCRCRLERVAAALDV